MGLSVSLFDIGKGIFDGLQVPGVRIALIADDGRLDTLGHVHAMKGVVRFGAVAKALQLVPLQKNIRVGVSLFVEEIP